MALDLCRVKIETMRGSGPGGQRKNKVETCVRATDTITGISVVIDSRSQRTSLNMALKELEKRILNRKQEARAVEKKERRDKVIHDHTVIRTYNFSRNTVTDHRTGKTASIKQILKKGQIDLLR